MRGLVFLVVSCPCALVISIPVSYFGGVGGASARGILVKGGNYLDALGKVKTVVFDKTGTLTKGRFKVAELSPSAGFSEKTLLLYAAAAEGASTHPIAVSIREKYAEDGAALPAAEDVKERAGYGVSAAVKGRKVICVRA
jgi:Cd2+/Zn2+-exporting ATPase